MIFNRGHCTIVLWNSKNIFNIGGAMRAAACYDADLIVISGNRKIKSLKHLSTDTPKAWRHIPTLQVEDPFDAMPLGAIPIAVDLLPDAVSLPKFSHPERAFYIFGPEDGTISSSVHEKCKYKIMIPSTVCMNLAACVNVVLYDRMAKRDQGV
jgi:tRNA(Leu) C34 or U34 (ribose-2'-O)-methylase TrmL